MRFSALAFAALAQQVAQGEAESTTVSSTSGGAQSTKVVTKTNSPTLIWTTKTLENGALLPFKTPFSQKFTAYFSGIAEPLSGSIGLGYLRGSIGGQRSYPLTQAPEASVLYSDIQNYSGRFNYTGANTLELNTDRSGRIIPRSWATIVAFGGEMTWFGPTYTQASQDLTGWSSMTAGQYAQYTGNNNLGQGSSVPAAALLAPVETISSVPPVTTTSLPLLAATTSPLAVTTTSLAAVSSTFLPGVAVTTASAAIGDSAAASSSSLPAI